MDRKLVFVAYPAGDTILAAGIMEAVRKANALPLPVLYEPWPFNDIAGNQLVSPILEKIDDSPFVVADITYLNLNVVYEVGFTIGKCKRAFLVRHKGTTGDKDLANAVGIFDTIGDHGYDDFEHLKARLAAHIEETNLPFSTALDRKSPVYLIEPPKRGTDVGVMVSRIKKAGYGRYRSFTPEEDSRLSGTDAIRQVAASSGVFIPLQDTTVAGSNIHNIRCMFIAGLCDGMGSPSSSSLPQGTGRRSTSGTTRSSGTSSPTSTTWLLTSVRASSSTPGRLSRRASTARPCCNPSRSVTPALRTR
jgi:hypothetical protein